MIKYYSPINDNVINPSNKFLKDIIFNTNSGYWELGSGDSCIEVDGLTERLIFFYDKYGFFVLRHPDYLVKYKDLNNKDTFIHCVGGEATNFPITSCLTREETYNIIINFINKKPFDEDEWIDLYEIIDFEF